MHFEFEYVLFVIIWRSHNHSLAHNFYSSHSLWGKCCAVKGHAQTVLASSSSFSLQIIFATIINYGAVDANTRCRSLFSLLMVFRIRCRWEVCAFFYIVVVCCHLLARELRLFWWSSTNSGRQYCNGKKGINENHRQSLQCMAWLSTWISVVAWKQRKTYAKRGFCRHNKRSHYLALTLAHTISLSLTNLPIQLIHANTHTKRKKNNTTIKCFHNSCVQFLFISRTIQNFSSFLFIVFFSLLFFLSARSWHEYIVYICFCNPGVTLHRQTEEKNISTCCRSEHSASNNDTSPHTRKKW